MYDFFHNSKNYLTRKEGRDVNGFYKNIYIFFIYFHLYKYYLPRVHVERQILLILGIDMVVRRAIIFYLSKCIRVVL